MMTTARTVLAVVALSLVSLSCEGPMGPQGPQGPPGPVGPQGPRGESTVTMTAQGTIPSDGGIVAAFPSTDINNALVNCWVGNYEQGTLIWIKVSLHESATCAATQSGTSLRVALLGPVGWRYLVVVVRFPTG